MARAKRIGLTSRAAKRAEVIAITYVVRRHDGRMLVETDTLPGRGHIQREVIQRGLTLLQRFAGTDAYYDLARGFARKFVQSHPEYTLSDVPPTIQGNSNRVLFAMHGDESVVMKYYGEPARKSCEAFALAHLAKTGLVPKIVDPGTRNLLIMERLPSVSFETLLDATRSCARDQTLLADIGRQIGHALEAFSRVSPPTFDRVPLRDPEPGRPDFQRADLREMLRLFLDASWRVYEREPCYHTPFFRRSLMFQESQLAVVAAQPQFLYLSDLNPGNVIVHDGMLRGFIDLEVCRCGTESMQLGSALFNFADYPTVWTAILNGYEKAAGRFITRETLEAARAMSQFDHWMFINCWAHTGPVRPQWFRLPDAGEVMRYFERCEALITRSIEERS